MNKNYIKEISIKNVGQHLITKFKLGETLTVVAAANGSGKSTFVNILDEELSNYINLEILDMKNAEIEITRGDNKKNSIVFVEEINEFEIRRRKNLYQPKFSVFNDQKFNQIQTKHHKGNLLISLNKEFNEMQEAEKLLSKIDEIIKNEKLYVNFKEVNQDVLDQFKDMRISFSRNFDLRKNKEIFKKDMEKLVDTFNKSLLTSNFKFLKNYNSTDVKALVNFIKHEAGEKIESPFMRKGIFSRTNVEENDFFTIKNYNKKISMDDVESLTNNVMWLSYFEEQEHALKRRLYRPLIRNENSLKILNGLNISIEAARKIAHDIVIQATLKYKKAEEQNKKIAESLSDSLKTVYMGQKIKINKDLSITNKKGETVILSTGELKILNLMIFLEEARKNPESLIVLDDPLTSVDAENVDLFIRYLKNFLKETKMQAVFLTHSNTVLQSLFIFFEFDKNGKGKSIFYKWDLDNKYKVECKKIEKIEPAINKYFSIIKDKSFDLDFRLHNARRFFELLCLGVYGHNDFQRCLDPQNGKTTFRILGVEHVFNSSTFKYLNSSSHGGISDNDDSLNLEKNKRIALSEILLFLRKVKFKSHGNISITKNTKII